MRYSYLVSMIVALMFSTLSVNAFADCGPFGGSGGGGPMYSSCEPNPWNLSPGECMDYCSDSEYCATYYGDQHFKFGGFWRSVRFTDTYLKSSAACAEKCLNESALCDPYDEECMAWYKPRNAACDVLTEDEDEDYCYDYCVNDNILNSKCGRDCLIYGIENTDIRGCQDYQYYCSNLCYNYDYYVSSIPMNYNDRWRILGMLVALLAMMSVGTLVVIHRKSSVRTEDKHS